MGGFTIDVSALVQIFGAFALVLTAAASLVAAFSSLRNGKIATKVKSDVDANTIITAATAAKVDQITLEVNGRFSATQAQLSRVIEHVIAINPEIIAQAARAAEALLVAAEKARKAALVAGPLDVHVVTDDDPIPVHLVPAPEGP